MTAAADRDAFRHDYQRVDAPPGTRPFSVTLLLTMEPIVLFGIQFMYVPALLVSSVLIFIQLRRPSGSKI